MQEPTIGTPHPTIHMLSDEQIRIIHDNSLDILSNTGIRMDHEGALTILLEAGAQQAEERIEDSA